MALNEAKERRLEFVTNTGIPDVDLLISTLAMAAQFMKAHRTRRQATVIALLRSDTISSHQEAAKKLGVSPPLSHRSQNTADIERS